MTKYSAIPNCATRPKPVPPGYEPVGTIRSVAMDFDNLEDAVDAFIVAKLPPQQRENIYIKDEVGAILLGYHYIGNEKRWQWYGITKAFEIVQAHPAIDSFAAIRWEQCARDTLIEVC
jgi:hypothetical protein